MLRRSLGKKFLRRYECDRCDVKFLTKGDLDRHQKVHTGIQKELMDVAFDLFIVFFSGERPFACDLCVKTFSRRQSLTEHLNRHYGRTPHKCKICGKGD